MFKVRISAQAPKPLKLNAGPLSPGAGRAKKNASPSWPFTLPSPALLLGVIEAVPSMNVAVLRGSKDDLLPKRVGGPDEHSLPAAVMGRALNVCERNTISLEDVREQTLAVPPMMGVASEVNRDGAEPNGCEMVWVTVGVASEGQKLAGVSMPAADFTDPGDGSRLPGSLVRRATGANGHTMVLHVVEAAFAGVTVGLEVGDGPGKDSHDAGALRLPFLTNASAGSNSFVGDGVLVCDGEAPITTS